MSKWNYIASTFKPTAVCDAVVSKFFSEERNLCVAKGERIEIYGIVADGLELLVEIPMNSHVCSMKTLRYTENQMESLVVLTHTRRLMQMIGNEKPKIICDIAIASKVNKNEEFYKVLINTAQTLACVYVQQSYFTVVKITQGKLGESFQVCLDDLPINDYCFLANSNKIAVCYTLDRTVLLKFFEIDSIEQELIPIDQGFPFDEITSKLIPLPSGGLLVFFSTFYISFDQIYSEYLKTPCANIEIKAYHEITPSKFILSSSNGSLYLLTTSPTIQLDLLGTTSVASCIAYLDNSIFYLGSLFNNSKILKVLSESLQNSFLEELQDFPNIGPILDFKVFTEPHRGVFDIITCSGTNISGGFRNISKGISAVQELAIEIPGVTGIWTISLNGSTHTHLCMSFYSQTQIFQILDLQILPINLSELVSLKQKTFHFQVSGEKIIHIAPGGIFVYSKLWEIGKVVYAEDIEKDCKISNAWGFDEYLVVLVGVYLVVVFTVVDEDVLEVWRCLAECEVSCVAGGGEYIAFGHWEQNNVKVMDKTNGKLVYEEKNMFTAAVRSIKFTVFSGNEFMILGLRDGFLLHYLIKNKTFSLQKKVSIGYQAVILEELKTVRKNGILAACDTPVVLYHENNTIYTTDLNISHISFACSFNTESSPDCLAIVSQNQFSVVSLPELQLYSVKSYIKKITIRRLVHIDDKFGVISITSDQIYSLQIYDLDKNLLDSVQSPTNEILSCIHAVESKIYLGTGVATGVNNVISGKIKVFSLENLKLNLQSTINLDQEVTSLNSTSTHIIAGVYNEIHYFKITENSLEPIENNQKMGYVLCIDVFSDLIAVADLIRHISVYKPISNKLQLTYKNYTSELTTAIKFISSTMLMCADAYGNLLILEAMPSKILLPISGFNIGLETINCISRLSLTDDRGRLGVMVFATSKGRIGTVIGITEKEFAVLTSLQKCLYEENNVVEVKERNGPRQDGVDLQVHIFIQGDIVEMFLDMSAEKQSTLALMVSEKSNEPITAEVLSTLITSLMKLH